ncbi:hypothetical protein SISNIDRAFT_490336 [Sistotremastrum niveocremeum HHB9708]|uniref:Uncharacterized protein n=1 Tax=Sistotremastrum niveocremeum HHB9708 TaxID=1314777 RepID=A0A164P3Q7_9AGAM|nr:hypothetical protein SISNIDRAFT_490336 [Sistotremastrum niveocremeum HHB9708]
MNIPESPPAPEPEFQTRRGRNVRQPARFHDFLPHDLNEPEPEIRPLPEAENDRVNTVLPRIRLVLNRWRTKANKFGLFREYSRKPGFVPRMKSPITGALSGSPHEATSSPAPSVIPNICDTAMPENNSRTKSFAQKLADALQPFHNYSTFSQTRWYLRGGTTKLTKAKHEDLINNVYHPKNGMHFDTGDVTVKAVNKGLEDLADFNPNPDLFSTVEGVENI